MNFEFLSFLLNNKELSEEAIAALVGKLKPLLYSVAQEGFNVYKDVVDNDEYFRKMAQMKKKTYDAYCQEGFSPEQAMVLLLDAEVARNKLIKQATQTINSTQN